MQLRIVFATITLNHDGLGGSLFANEEDALGLLCDTLDDEVGSNVVHIRNENGEEVWDGVWWVVEVLYSLVPVLPLSVLVGDELVNSFVT